MPPMPATPIPTNPNPTRKTDRHGGRCGGRAGFARRRPGSVARESSLEMTAVTSSADPAAAVEVLAAARSVTVLCHVQPDADTVGSGLALAQVLHRRGVPVQVSFAEPAELPASMRSLPGVEYLVPAEQVAAQVDVLVTVDCGSVGRLGALADRIDGATTTVVIDHHRSNTRFGDVNLIDETAESTTSVLARLFDAWGEEIDRDIAHCLFAGLVTD